MSLASRRIALDARLVFRYLELKFSRLKVEYIDSKFIRIANLFGSRQQYTIKDRLPMQSHFVAFP